MSRIELDDLVATFTDQHIGQEQMDLAALQTQLAQSLKHFNSSPPYPSPIQTQSFGFQHPPNVVGYTATTTSAYGPNNTPTSTPSPLWGPPSLAGTSVNRSRSVSRHRSNSVSAGGGSGAINTSGTSGRMAIPVDIQTDWEEMEEVEEELASASAVETEDFDPRPQNTFSSSHYSNNNPSNSPTLTHARPPRRRGSIHSNSTASPFSYAPSHQQQQQHSSPSSFASSDPFYIAAVHAQRSAPSASNAYIAPPIGFGSQFVAQSQARGGRWATGPGGT